MEKVTALENLKKGWEEYQTFCLDFVETFEEKHKGHGQNKHSWTTIELKSFEDTDFEPQIARLQTIVNSAYDTTQWLKIAGYSREEMLQLIFKIAKQPHAFTADKQELIQRIISCLDATIKGAVKPARAEIEALIKHLQDWQSKQPEFTTGIFPDEDRTLTPVDKLMLARFTDQAKIFLQDFPNRKNAIQDFATALGNNSLTGTLVAATPLIEALCELRNTLSNIGTAGDTQNNVTNRPEQEQGLKTLEDYRRAARDTLFERGLFPKSESKSFYDAVKTALLNCRELIIYSRIDPSVAGLWDAIILPHTKYEMRNPPLFDSIKLMEFVITYRHVKFIDDVYKNWPVRPDVNAMVFTSAGISFLEAAFRFVFEMGCDIIGLLQNAYKEHIREGNIIYASPFKFLDKTPSVDDLKINPLPDIIIRTWFDKIMKGIKREFPENEFSRHKLTAEFNLAKRQLEHEWNIWNKNTETPSGGKTGTAGNTEKLGKSLDLYDVIESLRHYKKSQNISALPPIQQVHDTLCKYRGECGAKTTDTIDWLGSAARDNSGYYPALLQELTSDEVMAYIEEWNQKSQTNGMAGDEKATNRTIYLFKVPIAELIKQGENNALEFKETLEYDTQQSRKNSDVLFSSLKAIAGFLNATGGTLLIGVHDSGEIKGIEKDLSVMKRGNNDRFEQQIRNCLKDRFEPQPIGKVDVSFEKLEEKTVCRIDIQASKEPIHLDDEVYVRDGNTTQLLKGRRLTDWIQQRKLQLGK